MEKLKNDTEKYANKELCNGAGFGLCSDWIICCDDYE